MDLLGKDLNEYIGVIKMPVIVSAAISLIGLVVNVIVAVMGKAPGSIGALLGTIGTLIFGVGALIVGVVLALYVGWIMVKNRKGTIVNSLIGGALFGLVTGIIGGLLNIVSTVVNIIFGVGGASTALIIAMAAGVLIFGPIISLIIDGILATIGGFVAQLTGGK
ncbi:MAG: hypothetical protein V1703_03320 [Candidatus Altiarchaeota archaeon]